MHNVLFKLRASSTGFNLNHRARYRFLMMLGETMIKPNMVTQSQLSTGLNLSTTMAFQAFNFEVRPQANQRKIANEEVKKDRCHMCPRKKDRKSLQTSSECELNVCDEHFGKVLLYVCYAVSNVIKEYHRRRKFLLLVK